MKKLFALSNKTFYILSFFFFFSILLSSFTSAITWTQSNGSLIQNYYNVSGSNIWTNDSIYTFINSSYPQSILADNICYSNGTNCSGGGNPFDQSLNTTDDVNFNSVTATTVGATTVGATNLGFGTQITGGLNSYFRQAYRETEMGYLYMDWLYPFYNVGEVPITTYMTIPATEYNPAEYSGGLQVYNNDYTNLFGGIDGVSGNLIWEKDIISYDDVIAKRLNIANTANYWGRWADSTDDYIVTPNNLRVGGASFNVFSVDKDNKGVTINGYSPDSDTYQMQINPASGQGSTNVVYKYNNSLMRFTNDGDIGIFGMSSNHDIRLRTNWVDRMTILKTGEIGINKTNPSYTLDVNGNVSSLGYYANGNQGLTTNKLINGSTSQCWLNYTSGILIATDC